MYWSRLGIILAQIVLLFLISSDGISVYLYFNEVYKTGFIPVRQN